MKSAVHTAALSSLKPWLARNAFENLQALRYLPVLEGTQAESGAERAPAPSLAELRGTETILIAEDHESIREMSRQALLGMGYRVLSACDGQEALRLCSHETPALAILDVIMPKLGGPATAASLFKTFPGLPVVFTSGYSADASEPPAEGRQARYLQKPYSPTTLGRLVREILDQHRVESQLTASKTKGTH